jgi:hypothetical protein
MASPPSGSTSRFAGRDEERTPTMAPGRLRTEPLGVGRALLVASTADLARRGLPFGLAAMDDPMLVANKVHVLRHTFCSHLAMQNAAEREGFEPSVPLRVHMISKSPERCPSGADVRLVRHFLIPVATPSDLSDPPFAPRLHLGEPSEPARGWPRRGARTTRARVRRPSLRPACTSRSSGSTGAPFGP